MDAVDVRLERMKAAEDERRELLDRQGPLTPLQAAALARRTQGLAKIRAILAEPLDTERNLAGVEASRHILRKTLHEVSP